jgi:hypothetical protein
MTNSRRASYNKLKYDAIRQQHEAIKAFKAANPERFAELLKKVEEDVATPSPLSNSQVFVKSPHTFNNRLNEIIAEVGKGRKDYFIYTEIEHNGWVETHKYFEMLYNPTVEEACAKVNERWETSYLPAHIKRVEKCSCPACV